VSIDGERVARWSAVAGRTVYFAHRSVGAGVVTGVAELTDAYSLPLRLVQTREPASETGPAFVHFIVGTSGDYASKNAAVLRLLESHTRALNPVLVLKYCYGDIRRPGDQGTMFGAYCETVETIQSEHPDVTVIHTTLPLAATTRYSNWGASQLLGRQTLHGVAVARHRYNELLRAEFGGGDPVFDIARVESTKSDGTVCGFSAGGRVIETLATENTYDGVHLNPRGERVVAETLLDVLADVVQVA
jgi:hypothetical protein